MSLVNRNITRTILNAAETTEKTASITSSPLAFVIGAADAFYLGYQRPFTTRFLHLETVNSNAITLSVDTWDGTAWQPVEDLVDQTLGLTKSGFLSWKNRGDWQKKAQTPVTATELYWARMKVSGATSAGTSLQSLLNLFSDDDLLRAYYPEIVSDSRYLPPSRTDFLEQHQAAKDLVVLRLIQMNAIEEENQIIDANEVCIAAVHACAYMILNPIAVDDTSIKKRDKAFDDMNYELKATKDHFDRDDDGVTQIDEERVASIFVARR